MLRHAPSSSGSRIDDSVAASRSTPLALRHSNHRKDTTMDIQFTTKAQDALGASVRIAAGNGNPQVEPIHLLDSLLQMLSLIHI